MRGQVELEQMVIMADSPTVTKKDKDSTVTPLQPAPSLSPQLNSSESGAGGEADISNTTTPAATPDIAPVLPNGGGVSVTGVGGNGDSTSCSTGTNSNASSTQNLAVTANGYDVIQNGHLSASEDSGMGNMSDQGSQSSQSPNSNTNMPQFSSSSSNNNSTGGGNKGMYYPRGGGGHHHSRGGGNGYPMSVDPNVMSPVEDLDPDDPLLSLSGGGQAPPANHHHHHHTLGSTSPNCYSPNHPNSSRGNSPNSQQGSPHSQPQQPTPQQHVVHVHVNPGETFSVRVGDQIQHIQGPATVRMVSNNGPPLPMPMQVPPGHMVQQIVDENGILTHVILSPQPPGMGGAPVTVGYYGGPNGTGPAQPPLYPGHPGGYGGHNGSAGYNPYPAQYTPHHHPHPPPPPPPGASPHHVHSHPPPPPGGVGPGGAGGPPPNTHIPAASSHQCNNHPPHMYPQGAPQSHHTQCLDERTQKAKSRLTKKLKERKQQSQSSEQLHTHSTSPRARGGGGGRPQYNNKEGRMNGDIQKGGGCVDAGGHSSSSSVDGLEMDEEERRLIKDCLSKSTLPKVSDIEPRSALISLCVPEFNEAEVERLLDPRVVFQYELLLSEKKDAKYKCVYTGTCTGITLKDLKPATDYHLRVCCIYDSIKGELTDSVGFKTQCCEPECPLSPKLSQKTKTTMSLKWNQAVDNGCKISSYTLEYDQGLGNMQFSEVFNGLQRQYKVTKLAASTRYTFRLAAINSYGKSEFCEPVSYCTSGTVPSQPDPPMLSEQFVKALTISWIQRQNDDDFTLQMEDEATGHGFLTVYNGCDLSYNIKNLRRNTEYKFRLQSSNDEGSSKWSDAVCYKTLPDRPAPPTKPLLKGKAHSHSFRITWDAPRDTGGTEVQRYCVEVDAGRGFEVRYEGVEKEFTCDQLEPGHCYRVRVKCYTVGGQSEWSECLVVTTQAVAPGKCHVPRLQGKPRATSLHLKWNYPDYDGGSRVLEFEVLMTNPDNSSREVYRGQECDCVVAGLLPGRYYLFQVRANNKTGAGPWSDILEVVSGAGMPDPPKVPCVHCRSPHCCVVTWDEPLNNGATITEYKLEWQARPEADFVQLHNGAVLSYEVKNLTPATSYSFRVQAINSAGPGAYSPVANVVTPPSSPGSVVSLRASASAKSIHLTWKQPISNGSEIMSYNIDLGEKHLIAVGGVVTEYVIEDLLPETTYKVRVQAVNGIGVGAFSTPVKVTTRSLPPSPPRLECSAHGSNSLKLKWGEGKNPELLQYCLEMLKDNGIYYPVYQGTAHTHKINRLQEMTEYSFRVNARNQAGEGPYSQEFGFKTTKAPPPAVKEPVVSRIDLDSCEVNWPVCKAMGKDTLMYVLQLQSHFGKDRDYKQIYRGTTNSYKVTQLQSNCEYQVRVCAVRECQQTNINTTSTSTATPQSGTSNSNTSSTPNNTVSNPTTTPTPTSGASITSNSISTSTPGVTTTVTTTTNSTTLPNGNAGGSGSVNNTLIMETWDLTGAFSPGVAFTTSSPKPVEKTHISPAGVIQSKLPERRPLTDQQWAAIILGGFTVFAIIIAFLAQKIITYTSSGAGGAANASDSQSPLSNDSSMPPSH